MKRRWTDTFRTNPNPRLAGLVHRIRMHYSATDAPWRPWRGSRRCIRRSGAFASWLRILISAGNAGGWTACQRRALDSLMASLNTTVSEQRRRYRLRRIDLVSALDSRRRLRRSLKLYLRGIPTTLAPGEEPTEEERRYQTRAAFWGAYSALQSTKPQTLAFSL
jgi:hypothetical protein